MKRKYKRKDSFIKNLFLNRRKQIVNNLHASYSVSKETIQTILINNNLKVQARAEELSVSQIVLLCDAFYEEMKRQAG